MPSSADVVMGSDSMELGHTVQINAASPLRLDRLEGPFTVSKGYADLFAVSLAAGEVCGARHHILRIIQGDLAFGIPAFSDTAVIVVGSLDAEIRYLPPAALLELTGPSLAPRLDGWILSIADAVFGSAPAWPEVPVNPGTEIFCAADARLYAARSVAWMKPLTGSFVVMEDVMEAQADAHVEIPLAAAFHARAITQAQVAILATEALSLADTQRPLERFYRHVAEGIARRIASTEESSGERLSSRERVDISAMAHAVTRVARVVDPNLPGVGEAISADPLLFIFSIIARSLDCTVPSVPAADLQRISLPVLARLAGLGTRRVLLRDDWWRKDNGPLIGRWLEDNHPVALMPGKRGGYRLVDGTSEVGVRVTSVVAAGLASDAVILYPPMPKDVGGIAGIAAFALRGSLRDLASVLQMGLLGGVLGSAIPIATGFLFEWVVPRAELGQMAAVVVGLILAAIGAASVELVKSIALVRLEARMEGLLQPAIMRRLLALPVGFYRDFGVGDLTDRVLAVQRMRRLIAGTTIVSLLSAGFAVVSFIVILLYSLRLALLSAGLVAVASLITVALSILQLRHERTATRLGGQEDGLLIQLIQGISKLRVSASESRLFALWSALFAQRKSALVAAQRYANLRNTFYGIYPILASILLFQVASGSLGTRAGNGDVLTLGAFLTVSTAFGQLLMAMIAGAGALAATLGAVPLFERLRPIVTARPERQSGNVDPGPLTGEIELSHVSFRYGYDTPLVLDDVSLHTEPGQLIAIVGSSGSGKSTMLRLLLGFETAESGDILYQGQSIGGVDAAALRRRIGVVLQNARILSGSIFENITAGLPYTLEEAWDAARMAGIAADIEAMPMGMHTVLIEGAATLSGGQAQRLMIARALVGKPQILIFDEATSALDSASQAVVISSLNRLHVMRIVIAHRLTTVKDADCIFVLDRGRLVESGDFSSLMARRGVFYALAQRQLL